MSKIILIVIVTVLAIDLSRSRKVVESLVALNHTWQLYQQQCHQNRICRRGICDIVPKNISVQREVEQVIDNKGNTTGWTCVQMENVDGICKNEKMERAQLKHKMVQVMRNAKVCNSTQNVTMRLATRKQLKYFLENDRSLNDACMATSITADSAKYDCNKLIQTQDVDIDYMVGGYSQKVDIQAQTLRDLTVNTSKHDMNVSAKLVSFTARSINATFRGKQINLKANDLLKLKNCLNQDSEMSIEKAFAEHNANKFDNDYLNVVMNNVSLNSSNPKVILKKELCRKNSLCRVKNCDKIEKSKQVSQKEEKWVGGYLWMVNLSRGWKCDPKKKYFSGCYAYRYRSYTQRYTEERNSICGTEVDVIAELNPTVSIKLQAESLLDACKTVSHDKASCEIYVIANYIVEMKAGNNKETVKANHTSSIKFMIDDVQSSKPKIADNSIKLKHPFNEFDSKHPDLFKEPRYDFHKKVESQIVDVIGRSSKGQILFIADKMSQMQSGTMDPQNVTYTGSFNNSKNVTIDNHKCRSNPICAQNCEYISVNQTYTINQTKTVAEANQTAHEDKGWKCVKTLNNVTRCADDLYKQNQTFIETIHEEADKKMCYSNVSRSVTLDNIDIYEVELKSIGKNCQQDDQNETQVLVCQGIKGTASWNYTLQVAGRTATFNVESVLQTSVEVSVSHNLKQNDIQQANFDIKQSEVDDEVLDNRIDGRHDHIDEETDWFNNMSDIVNTKVRKQIFATVLEHVRIKNNRVTFE